MKTIFKNENKHLVACLTPDTDTERTIIQHLYESGYIAKINSEYVVTITETNIDLEEEMYKKIIAIVSDYGVKFDVMIENVAAIIDQTHTYSQVLSDDKSTNLAADLHSITTTLGNKVDIVEGKGLSTNDFSNTYKKVLDELVDSLSDLLHEVTVKMQEHNASPLAHADIRKLANDNLATAKSYADTKIIAVTFVAFFMLGFFFPVLECRPTPLKSRLEN